VALAREGRYADAKAAFLEAYAAYPHYLVLYNVAQADLQLGNLESAREYLERFLREGKGSLRAEREREVRDQLDDITRRLEAEHTSPNGQVGAAGGPRELGSDTPAQAASERPPPAGSSSERAASASNRPSALAAAPRLAPASPSAGPPRVDARRAIDARGTSWGLVLGGSGALLIGVASGLFIYNDGRHADWKRARADLDAVPDREQALERDPGLWRQAKANNDLLASIERVDVVTVLTAGIGALALGAGAWEILSRRTPTDSAIVASGSTLSWRTTW
jgi:tetratricopeptide (TPR) repeat protein